MLGMNFEKISLVTLICFVSFRLICLVYLQEIFELLKTFKLHLEHVNPRLDPLEAYKNDSSRVGRQQAEEVEKAKEYANIVGIEHSVDEFRKSIDDIIVELKAHCAKSSTSS